MPSYCASWGYEVKSEVEFDEIAPVGIFLLHGKLNISQVFPVYHARLSMF